MDANGTLSFIPATNANGVATVTLHIHDDGGTAGGGSNASATQNFTITVSAVNDAPSFTIGARVDVAEDCGAQTSNGWATSISKGPADEAAQTLSFTVTADHTELFSVQPALSNAGVLTFTPAAHAVGTATLTVWATDSAGGQSATQTAVIAISEINDTPSFTKGGNLTVNEDAGIQIRPGWATAISAGPASEAAQMMDFVIDSNSNAALFSQVPAVNPDGTLSFVPAADANGVATITLHVHDNGGTAGGGSNASATQIFTITVTAVNDTPSFIPGPDLLVAEDAGAQSVAWATGISAGPADEAGQTLSFTVSTSAPSLFGVQPALATDGTLTFTPAANANGTAMVGVQLADDGGGADETTVVYFTITISADNDAPTQALPSARTVLEDGTLTLAGANAIVLSDVDAGSSWLMATVSVDHGTITLAQRTGLVFLVGDGTGDETITCTGTIAALNTALDGMTVHPEADHNGSMTLEVTTDDRGNTGGGNLGVTGTVGITVTAVNDAPSCVLGTAPTAAPDGQARTLSGWIASSSTGPADETAQTISSYVVTVDHPELFTVAPAIAADGTLTFTPGTSVGTALMSVVPVDDGGTANGGQDHGTARTCTITIATSSGDDDGSWWVRERDKATCGLGSGFAFLGMTLAFMLMVRIRLNGRR